MQFLWLPICSLDLPTKAMTASASLGILESSFMDLAAAGWVSAGRGWRDFLGQEQNKDFPLA